MAFAPYFMGMRSSVALLMYTIFLGLPIGVFCFYTKGGRIVGSFLTILYFTLYGMLSLIGMPGFPISALLYGYVFFFVFNLLFVMLMIVYPSFWIHLVAQGALEVNRKFNPSVGISTEEGMQITGVTNTSE